MNLLYYFFATTFTLTLPDISQPLLVGVANFIVSFCYFAIASLISLGLWRNREFGFDTFATVTALIFWSCALGHSGHAAEHLGLPHSPFLQTVSDWITVIPAIAFLSLSNRYSLLVGSTQILQSKKDTEQALSETTQRFQAIFDQAFPLIALLEPDGTLIEANQTALEFGNYQASEVLGRKFWHTPWWASSPTNQQRLKANIQQVSAGKFIRDEYEITGLNNQVIVIDLSFNPLLNEAGEVFEILAEGRDITQRKQTEAQLQQLTGELEQRVKERTEQILQTNTLLEQEIRDRTDVEKQLLRLKSILEATTDWVAMADATGQSLYMNRATREILNVGDSTDLAGVSISDVISPNSKDTIVKVGIPAACRDGVWSGEIIWQTLDGKEIPVSQVIIAHKSEGGEVEFLSTIARNITNRKRTEQALRQNLQMLDLASDALIIRELDGTINYWNQGAERMYGFSKQEALGKATQNLFHTISPQPLAAISAQLEQQDYWEGELIHTTNHNTKITVFSRWTLQRDEQGNPKAILETNNDITDRKQAEIENQRLTSIVESSSDFIGLGTMEGLLTYLNPAGMKLVGIQNLEELKTKTILESFSQEDAKILTEEIMPATIRDGLWQGEFRLKNFQTGENIPVDFTLFTLKDPETGEPIGLATMTRDISDRKRAEEMLRDRERLFRAIFDQSFQLIGLLKPDGTVLEVNQTALTVSGLRREEVIGTQFAENSWWQISPDSQQKIREAIALAATGELVRYEADVLIAGGAVTTIDFSIKPIKDDNGKVVRLIPEGRDISDRKNLERELALRQARFDAFFAAAPASMFIFDDHLRFVQVNEKMAETTGPSVAEHLGKTVREVVPEMVHTLEPMLQQILATNQPFLNIEVSGTNVNQPGAIRDWLASYFPLPGEDGKPIGVGGVAVEITDRKQAITKLEETTAQLARSESEFRQQSNLLQLLINSIAEGVVAADTKGNFVLFNPAAENIFGLGATDSLPDEWSAKYGLFLSDAITPYPTPDIPLTRTIRGEAFDDVEVFARHIGKPEGLWIKVNGRPLKDETGALKGGVIVCRNVTEERASQQQMQQLAESQERLLQELKTRQNALDEAAVVSETDLKGTITYVNERFTQISGYSMGELLNRHHRIVNSGYHPKSFFQEMWLTISRGLVWKGEIKNMCKNGSFYWVDSTIAPIFDTSGTIVKYIAIRFDITERKEAEEGLEKLAAERKAEADSMTQQVLKLLGEIKGAAQGDLTVRAEVTNDVLGAVADSFNFLIGSLRKVVTGIQTLAEQVTFATDESITNTSQLTEQAEVQAVKISAIMREIERIVNSIRDVRDVSVRAETVAQQSSHTAEVGGMAVDRAVEGINELRLTIASTSKMMKRLGESSQQIGKIVTSISQLASQTNLLALNATIEAARAGEQGLGFAVVAEEVRKLAERSAGATEEISEIVGTIQEEISRVMKAMESGTLEVVEGTKLASEAKTHLNAIIEVSREMNALVQNITRASAKQTVSAEEISNSMQQVNEIANTTAQKGSDVKASLDDLSGSVSKLQKSVANFRS